MQKSPLLALLIAPLWALVMAFVLPPLFEVLADIPFWDWSLMDLSLAFYLSWIGLAACFQTPAKFRDGILFILAGLAWHHAGLKPVLHHGGLLVLLSVMQGVMDGFSIRRMAWEFLVATGGFIAGMMLFPLGLIWACLAFYIIEIIGYYRVFTGMEKGLPRDRFGEAERTALSILDRY